MPNARTAGLCLALAAWGTAHATALPPTSAPVLQPADLNRLVELSTPVVSPDGQWLAYAASTPDAAANKNRSSIWVRAWDGSGAREITGPEAQGAAQPAFLADSSAVAFLSEGGEDHLPQVWIQPLRGGPQRMVTHLPGGVADFTVSPDGHRLVAVADAPPPVHADDRVPIVIDRLLFKDDEQGYLGAARRHLFVVSLDSGAATQITRGAFDALLPAWSPDGKRIVYVSRHDEESGRPLGYDLYCIDAATGDGQQRVSAAGRINNDPDHLSRPAWAPDSRRIAYIQGGAEKWLEYAPW